MLISCVWRRHHKEIGTHHCHVAVPARCCTHQWIYPPTGSGARCALGGGARAVTRKGMFLFRVAPCSFCFPAAMGCIPLLRCALPYVCLPTLG